MSKQTRSISKEAGIILAAKRKTAIISEGYPKPDRMASRILKKQFIRNKLIPCSSELVKTSFNLVTKCRTFCTNLNSLIEAEVEFNDRDTLVLSSGKLAKFADGCAVARLGDTSVMVTAVSRLKPSIMSFLPLTVDYRQKAAAAGRIPTNFLRRELGPTEHEVLVSRLIDRSLRPLFPNNYFCETQIICNLLAVDGVHDPEVLCINAASTALSLSNIPWNGPVGAVRIGLIDNEVVVNPTRRELINSTLNMVITATSQNLVVMIEAQADNVLQPDFLKAIKTGVKECQKIIQVVSKLQKEYGKPKKVIESEQHSAELVDAVKSLSSMRVKETFSDHGHDKESRDEAIKVLRLDVLDKIKTENPELGTAEAISDIFNHICKDEFRKLVLETKVRCDGRSPTDLRPISCQVDLFKPLHGSALFQRGQTQVLCTVTLDSPNSILHMDPVTMLATGLKEKNFFLHYEFPPYATKDIGRIGPAVRREIGHGALAEKGLRPVLPQGYPFTVRLTSEVLESNGSSSMASVCGGSLALMDAGVPITAEAAGVAIGLVTSYDNNDTKHINDYVILTDILGIEDYFGDMDFKIAGSKKGISALQADIKIPGLPLKIVMEAVLAGCEAKSKIIDIMGNTIKQPRQNKKDCWPVVEEMDVPIAKRGKLIGPGGSHLKSLMAKTGVQVTYLEESGVYHLFAPNPVAMDEAKEFIAQLLTSTDEPQLEFGAVYSAKIVEMRENGVMVSLFPNMRPALLHLSQLDQRRVAHPSVLGFQVGQEIQVKYFGLDPVSGQMRLSRKVLMGPPSSTLIDLQDK